MDENPYRAPSSFEVSKGERIPPLTLPTRFKVCVGILSLLFYVIFLGALLHPDGSEISVKAFGENPFGLPVDFVVGVGATLLYAPVPFFLWHWMITLLWERHPKLWRSRFIYRVGMGYGALIAVAWILYAEYLGI